MSFDALVYIKVLEDQPHPVLQQVGCCLFEARDRGKVLNSPPDLFCWDTKGSAPNNVMSVRDWKSPLERLEAIRDWAPQHGGWAEVRSIWIYNYQHWHAVRSAAMKNYIGPREPWKDKPTFCFKTALSLLGNVPDGFYNRMDAGLVHPDNLAISCAMQLQQSMHPR